MSELDLDRVATIARHAADRGEGAAVAVAEAMGCSLRTANRYLSAARAAGLLPAPSELLRMTRNPKAVAVAAELGVPYDALIAAVVKHADGDLRVLGARHHKTEEHQ